MPVGNAVLVISTVARISFLEGLPEQTAERRVHHENSSPALRELVARQPTPIAAVIDGGLAHALQLARQVQAGAPLAELIFVGSRDDERRLRAGLRLTPLVAANWVIVPEDHPELDSRVRAQIRLGVQRARYRTTLSKVNLRLAGSEGPAGKVFQRLLVSERFLATLVKSSPDAIVTLSLEGEILSWNASAEAIWDRPAREAVGRRFEEFLEPGGAAPVTAAMTTVSASETFLRLEANAVRSNGTVPVELTLSRVRDEQREIFALVLFARDISEHKLFLRSQRMESIGTLATGIAHNLNNMLTPILMGAELLQQIEDRSDQRLMLEALEQSAGRAADLVRQLLLFGRGIEGVNAVVSLRHVIAEVTSMARRTFPQNIAITDEVAADLRPVKGDQTQMVQVLLNLCVNARDAMPQGGSLAIRAGNLIVNDTLAARHGVSAGWYAGLEVADTGTGIARENLERIFDPFFTTKEFGKGTGLGLSTALGIVRSHRGFLDVASEPGRGSTFRVLLPAQDDAVAAPAAILGVDRNHRGQGELILVIDDEPYMLSVITQILHKFGYRAITAKNGAVGLQEYERHRTEIAAVITDLMMPVMDGIEFITALRAIDPALPIIAMSGLTTNDQKAKEAGANHFLPKPCTIEALSGTLETVLAGRNRPTE